MTSPRIFRDNKAGVPYLYGEHLPSANASQIESALRRTEKIIYRTIVQNWFGPVSLAGIPNSIAAAFDATLGVWAVAQGPFGGGNVGITRVDPCFDDFNFYTPTVAAVAADVRSAASSGLGNIVFGLATGGASANKILQSNDGLNWVLRAIGGATTKPVSFIRWDSTFARFVALVSTGEAYTSSDGVTWTSRTVPGGLSAVTWTGLAISTAGMCVATASGTTNYMTSADGGITWVQRTGPANGVDVAYASGVGSSTGSGGFAWGTVYVSSDGINWSSMTSAPAATGDGVTKLVGLGPSFVAVTTQLGGSGGGAQVEIAFDQANPSVWTLVGHFRPADGFGGVEWIDASENQVVVLAGQSTDSVAYRSLSLGY